MGEPDHASTATARALQEELVQSRPFHSLRAEVSVSILRTAALIERHFAQVVARSNVTVQQYNVLRILRGAGDQGLPTLVIRDRMIHEAPGITRLLDKLEQAGLAQRDRTSPDRRQVFCRITAKGREVLSTLDEAMRAADDTAIGPLTDDELQELLDLLEKVRANHRKSK